jgi:hypothetical protein
MSILSPAMQKEANAISGMDPATALKYLRDHGVDQALAIGVLKTAQLQQANKLQQAIQQQNPPGNVLQQNDNAYAQMMNFAQQQQQAQQQQMRATQAVQQHAAEQSRQGGIADLPVSPGMYSFGEKKMAEGGIVAFASKGAVEGDDSDDGEESQFSQDVRNVIMNKSGTPSWKAAKSASPDEVAQQNKLRQTNEKFLAEHPSIDHPLSSIGNYFFGSRKDTNAPSAATPPANAAPAAASPVVPGDKKAASAADGTIPPIPPGGGFPTSYNAALSLKGLGNPVIPSQLNQMFTDQQDRLKTMEPKSVEDHFNNLSDIAQKQGIGKAADEHLKNLQTRGDTLQQMAKFGKWSALADAGFAMATAATNNPHGGFMGALAVGGAQGGKEFLSAVKEHRQAMNQLQDAKYAVQQSKENLINDRTKQAITAHENELNRYDRAFATTTDTGLRVAEKTLDSQNQALMRLATVRAAALSRASYNPQSDLLNIGKEYGVNSPQYKNAIEAYTQGQKATYQAQNAGLTDAEKREKLHQDMYVKDYKYKQRVDEYLAEKDPDKKKKLQTGLMQTLDAASGNFFNLDDYKVNSKG